MSGQENGTRPAPVLRLRMHAQALLQRVLTGCGAVPLSCLLDLADRSPHGFHLGIQVELANVDLHLL